MKKTRKMQANWTILLVLVLLGSFSSPKAGDAELRLRYSAGVSSIFEDSKGRFWFGSHNEGVCLYDGGEFTYYTMSDGLSDNQIRTIQEDEAGVIWFGTGGGITSFDGDEFKIHTGRNFDGQDVAIGDAWHKEPGDLWFLGDNGTYRSGDEGQGVHRYDGRSLSYLALPVPDGAGEENPYLVTSIVKGGNGTVWFGTYPGVFGYDGQSFTVINDETLGIEFGKPRLHVRSIFEDSKGNLWIGNNGLGVLFYDGQTVSNFTEQHGLSIREKGLVGSLGRIFSIAEDAAGNIWFGSRDNGAWRYDGESLTNFTMEDGLTSPMVQAIYRDKRDVMWFGMIDGSVCQFNGKSFDMIF